VNPDPGFDRQKLKKKKIQAEKENKKVKGKWKTKVAFAFIASSNRVYFANNIAYTRSGRRQMQFPIRIQGFDDQN
jgi:hypothetical protein